MNEEQIQNVPFFKFSFFFFSGCFLANTFLINLKILIITIIVCLSLLLLINLILRSSKSNKFILYFLIFLIGNLNIRLYKEKINSSSNYDETYIYGEGFISEVISRKLGKTKVILELNKNLKYLPEKILAYIDNKGNEVLKQGDIIIFKGYLKKINQSAKLSGFDNYKYFLNKNVLYQIFLKPENYNISFKNDFNKLQILFLRLQSKISDIISNNKKISEVNKAIIEALTIGIRSNITSDIKKIFVNSGAIHLLALSGLHVGIVYMIIIFLFKIIPLKIDEKINFIVVFSFLWAYCFLTGGGASVFRSTFMFSLFQISKLMEKKSNNLNILLFSAVFLIIIKPSNFYDHGYYLSHLAMGSIIIFYPLLYKLIKVNNKVLSYLWKLFCISLSAQILTLPYIAYFFKKVTIYSCLSSILIIPFLPFIIFLAIINICLLVFGVNFDLIQVILNLLVGFKLKILTLINKLPASELNVSIPFHMMLLIYFFIFSFMIFYYYKNIKQFVFAIMFSISFFLVIDIIFLYKIKNNKGLLVYKYNKICNIAFIDGFNIYLINNSLDKKLDENEIIDFVFKCRKSKKFKLININNDFYKDDYFVYTKNKLNNIKYFMFYGKKGIYTENSLSYYDKNFEWIIIDNNINIKKINELLEKHKNSKTEIIINGTNYYNRNLKFFKQIFYFIGNEGYYWKKIR